jgi:hypothetical protein
VESHTATLIGTNTFPAGRRVSTMVAVLPCLDRRRVERSESSGCDHSPSAITRCHPDRANEVSERRDLNPGDSSSDHRRRVEDPAFHPPFVR